MSPRLALVENGITLTQEQEQEIAGIDNLFSLDHRVSITVPSTANVDQPIDSQEFSDLVDFAIGHMSELFGGATVHYSTGGWKSANGAIVKENVAIVESYTDQDGLLNLNPVVSLAHSIKHAYGQESVALTVDDTLYFV